MPNSGGREDDCNCRFPRGSLSSPPPLRSHRRRRRRLPFPARTLRRRQQTDSRSFPLPFRCTKNPPRSDPSFLLPTFPPRSARERTQNPKPMSKRISHLKSKSLSFPLHFPRTVARSIHPPIERSSKKPTEKLVAISPPSLLPSLPRPRLLPLSRWSLCRFPSLLKQRELASLRRRRRLPSPPRHQSFLLHGHAAHCGTGCVSNRLNFPKMGRNSPMTFFHEE